MNDNENNRPGRSSLPLVLVIVGLLLVASVVIWLSLRIVQIPSQANQPAQAGQTDNSSTPFAEIKRIPLEEAKTAFDDQSAVFVDVRSADSYKQAHIPGAVNIPLGELENRIGELDPNKWIITYCT
jgi:hypothetical protein